MNIAVIGVGNTYRRDDGIGPAAADAIGQLGRPGVTVTVTDGEPTQLLDAWTGAALAIVIDAVLCDPAAPGRVHRTGLCDLPPGAGTASSHSLGIPEAVELADVLGLLPARLVVFAVEVADVHFGTGMSAEVAAALPDIVDAVTQELNRIDAPVVDR